MAGLVLAPAATGAGVVATDLGCVAAHGGDGISRLRRQVPQLDRGLHEVVDRRVEVLQRLLAVECGEQFAIGVVLRRQVAVQARQRGSNGIVGAVLGSGALLWVNSNWTAGVEGFPSDTGLKGLVVTDSYPLWVCMVIVGLGALVGTVSSATAASKFLDV